ncbi:unnamed protein product [Cylicocyclus nassatus]|uniref:Replication protein A C-terminal domain-containing protein n=1 Tax=Cylicocyclus nassatus TaxID=53992 RepID=A0AA36MCD1_CYLNA|nr:unnamed protein product [Cylicocyclus nassatus]
MAGISTDNLQTSALPVEVPLSAAVETLPVPVTVADLEHYAGIDEKFSHGDYHFSTVLTVGIVTAVIIRENLTIHVLADPENMDKEFEVFTYTSVPEGANVECGRVIFAKGVKLFVVGLLRCIDRKCGVLSFIAREICDIMEYEVFIHEAKIAQLYFCKNVPLILRSGGFKPGCWGAAGPPADFVLMSRVAASPAYGTLAFYAPEASNVLKDHGTTPRKKIIDLFQSEECNHDVSVGLSEEFIQEALKGTSKDVLRHELNVLVSEGHLYHTIDDKHFACLSR